MFFLKKRNDTRDELSHPGEYSKFFPSCFENFPIGISLTNFDGKILCINAEFTKLLGYNKKDTEEGLNASDIYMVPEERDSLLKTIKKDGKVKDFLVNLKCKDGVSVSVRLNATLISDGKNELLLTTCEDVSKVKKITKNLVETNKKFNFLYKNSTDAIMRISSPDWNFTAANKATLSMFRVRDEKTFLSLRPWEMSPKYQPDGQLSSEKAKKMIEKAVDEGSNFFEWKHQRSDGEEFFATVLLMRLEKNGEIFIQAIVHDISKEKKAEESLKKFVEETRKKLSGVVLLGEKSHSFSPNGASGNFDSFLSSIDAMVDTLKDRTIQLEVAQKSMSSLLEDILKEKKNAEESKKQTEAIIASSGDGILVVNKNGIVSFFNPAAEKMSEWKSSEVIGKKCCDTVNFFSDKEEKEPNLFIKESMSSGLVKKISSKAVLRKKDGSFLPVLGCVSPVKDSFGNVTGGILVFSDASKEREIERAKSEFVSLASHQLRTPISATLWFVEMLLSGEVGKSNEKQKEYLEEVNYLNRRMEAMVSMLLNISRVEMGTVIVEPVLANIGDFIDISLSHVKLILEGKNISLDKKIEEGLPLVKVDLKLLSIVMDNLLSNAANYTREKGHITVAVSKSDSSLVIAVADDGIGIPENDQSKIFTKLFRSDNAKDMDSNGTGIGLYMSKSIVESWNGTIRFSSPITKKVMENGEEKFVGTSFFITIPLSGMIKRKGTMQLI